MFSFFIFLNSFFRPSFDPLLPSSSSKVLEHFNYLRTPFFFLYIPWFIGRPTTAKNLYCPFFPLQKCSFLFPFIENSDELFVSFLFEHKSDLQLY